jgi:serine/threonine-protein kinase
VATRLGAYEILYELKTGGMGAVLLGRRRGPGAFEQLVAIKTILPEHAQAPAVRAMFLDEATILARLVHPAVATVHDFGEADGALYMVMEYVAGIGFREAMAHGMAPEVAARAIAEACRGVHAAHELRDLSGQLLGVVHRDISPDNLMLGFDGQVKVIDFGIALVKNRQSPVTEFGAIKGKPPYMSPEQIKNAALDRRSDVFSLGVVLWELLTGHRLFDGDSLYAIARAVEHQAIAPPSQVIGAALPPGLDAAVMNALDRDVARRTPSAAALAEQLEEVAESADGETLEAWADRVLALPRRDHRAWLASVVAGRDAPRPLGRATGSVTALAPPGRPPPVAAADRAAGHARVGSGSGASAVPAARATLEPAPDPRAQADLAVATGDRLVPPRRRSLALSLALALTMLGATGGGLYLALRAGEPAARAPSSLPGPVAAVAIDAGRGEPASDAPTERPLPPSEPPIQRPSDPPDHAPERSPEPPIDAGHRRSVRATRDAGAPPGRDPTGASESGSQPAAQPGSGLGKLTAKSKGETYLSVVLDGRVIGPTPVFGKAIPAGTHVVELVDVKTSRVVIRRTVAIGEGESVTVVEP